MEKFGRFSEYKIMWIFVFFDLPTETAIQRKEAALFRKNLLEDGFTMLQYSVYIRHTPSRENMEVHEKRVKKFLPVEGKVTILHITDKQFGDIHTYQGARREPSVQTAVQLELF